jgi:hypothetical protein
VFLAHLERGFFRCKSFAAAEGTDFFRQSEQIHVERSDSVALPTRVTAHREHLRMKVAMPEHT